MEKTKLAAAVAVAACLALPAAARADIGTAEHETLFGGGLVEDSGLRPVLRWSRAAGAPRHGALMNAGSSPSDDTPRAAYERLVDETALTVGLDSELLHAVIHVESGYDARAVSPQGAVGLMQLMPETARRYRVRNAFDPAQNLRGGASYLRDLVELFGNDLPLALAAYNAGEHAVIRNGYRVPRWKETMTYVGRVLALYRGGMLR